MRLLLLALLLTGCAHDATRLHHTAFPVIEFDPLPDVPRPDGDCDEAIPLDPGEYAPCGGVVLPTDLAERARVALEHEPLLRLEYSRMTRGREADRIEAQRAVHELSIELKRERRREVGIAIGTGAGGVALGVVVGVVLGVVGR